MYVCIPAAALTICKTEQLVDFNAVVSFQAALPAKPSAELPGRSTETHSHNVEGDSETLASIEIIVPTKLSTELSKRLYTFTIFSNKVILSFLSLHPSTALG